MMFHQPFKNLVLAFAFSTVVVATAVAAEDWWPVDPALLALKSPAVEKDADAEAVLWEVRVNDEDQDTVLSHRIRIKVFTERGKETQSKIDIIYLGSTKIKDIAGRTIKPDGTIVELKKDAVFERPIVKAGRTKLTAKSFAMPAVEPGVVIDYRWREVRKSNRYMRFQFQRDIPVQSVKYFIKPYSFFNVGMRSWIFNGPNVPFTKEKNGFYSLTMTNVPAFREEPDMPPEDEVRSWMLVYYPLDRSGAPENFWNTVGKTMHEAVKGEMKVNNDVRKLAAELVSGAATAEQKLQRLFDYCRTKIKNVHAAAAGLTDIDREKIKPNKSPADTLKHGMGTGYDINLLFAALATAAGFEARVAMLGDRSDLFFKSSYADAYFLRSQNVAVRVGNEWRFFDPSMRYVPFGMLRWQEEGQQALVTDPKEPTFVTTPISPASKSVKKRTATLRLSEDGTLEGDVYIEYTGHLALDMKKYNDDDSPQQRQETLRESVKKHMSTAELSNIRVENVTDPEEPFVYAYHVRVPGYAQRTGRRLFLQPAFFQRGVGPRFPTSARKYDVYFHYPWMEEEIVTIELPARYVLDSPEAPQPFKAGDHGSYDVKILLTGDKRKLQYTRRFEFNGLLFPATSYAQVKQVFDILHERDNHTLTLKQEEK